MSVAPIILSDLGAGEASVEVICWLVETGDAVAPGDRVVELAIPGVTFDVGAPSGGRIAGIETPVGRVVAPGEILGWIEQSPSED